MSAREEAGRGCRDRRPMMTRLPAPRITGGRPLRVTQSRGNVDLRSLKKTGWTRTVKSEFSRGSNDGGDRSYGFRLIDSGRIPAGAAGGLACVPSRGGGHGSHRRSSERRGTGSACPHQCGRLRGTALPGDLASGPGADGVGGGGRHRLRAALAGATGEPLQPVRPRGAG